MATLHAIGLTNYSVLELEVPEAEPTTQPTVQSEAIVKWETTGDELALAELATTGDSAAGKLVAGNIDAAIQSERNLESIASHTALKVADYARQVAGEKHGGMAPSTMKKAGATKERLNMGAIQRRKAEEAQDRAEQKRMMVQRLEKLGLSADSKQRWEKDKATTVALLDKIRQPGHSAGPRKRMSLLPEKPAELEVREVMKKTSWDMQAEKAKMEARLAELEARGQQSLKAVRATVWQDADRLAAAGVASAETGGDELAKLEASARREMLRLAAIQEKVCSAACDEDCCFDT